MRSRLDLLRAELPGCRVGLCVAGVIVVHLVAAWCNAGFLNPDEHYQILEFAQYKLGRQSAAALAWEFGEQMRPATQPLIAAGTMGLLQALGIVSPFLTATSLRVLSTLLGLWVSLELCLRCLPAIDRKWLKAVALVGSFLIWITPTVHGRFSSENWGGALLVGGLCLMLDAAQAWPTRRRNAIILAIGTGLVWSAAFYCRFQIGVAIAGGGLWLLMVRRAPATLLAVIAAAFVAGSGLNEIADHWLYGHWTCAPCNYFMVNLIQGKAATFGVSPWWMVAVYMAGILIPPYSLGVLAVLTIGFWYARHHVLVWVAVPFVVLHAVVAHKEPRFLIPLLYVVGPLLAACLDALPPRLSAPLFTWLSTPWGRVNMALWSGVNGLLLCAVILVPVSDSYRVERWLWEQGLGGPMTVYTVGEAPYHLTGNTTSSFYRSKNVALVPIESAQPLDAAPVSASTYVYYRGAEVPAVVLARGACLPVLRTLPVWLTGLETVVRLSGFDQSTICRMDWRP
jgi:GPI mannosyltransferase 3